MASGADEALVFDSLAERGREKEWPQVLDQVMRWQSLGFVVAMLVGGAVYDPAFVNRIAGTHFAQGTTLRFPIYLNLLTAAATLVVALGMREPMPKESRDNPGAAEIENSTRSAFAHLWAAGGWIARSPLALFVIVAGVTLDAVVRLFMTFSSSYFRLIDLPAASYGLIGAMLGGLGLAVSPLARRMVTRGSPAGNFAVLATVTVAGLIGVAARWPGWGVMFTVPLGMAMSAVAYLVSYYLNAAVDARQRATVLSFKGLAFNLGYGLVSLAFAGALRALRTGSPEQTFGRTLPFLPVWLGLADDNTDAAQDEIRLLVQNQGKKLSAIQEAVGDTKPEKYAGPAKADNAEMIKHLTPVQKEVYQQAQIEHRMNALKLQRIVAGMRGELTAH